MDRTHLVEVLNSRREVMAERWYQAIALLYYTSHNSAKVRGGLVELTAQIIALLGAETFNNNEAQAIGQALADLSGEPEALIQTHRVLVQQLMAGWPADQVAACLPRLIELLGGLSAGFLQRARVKILSEQEQIRRALTAELQRRQESLRRSRDEMEQQVQARTSELTAANTQLQQEIAERLTVEQEREKLIAELAAKNDELERFAYTVSHDLKSPLITIQGFLDYLKQDALAGHIEQMIGDIASISNAADQMQQLLSDLLKLSRIGRLMNPPETVSFDELAAEALAMVAGRLSARGIKVNIAPDLPAVYGDRTRLLEVLENLLDNAVKYMGDQPHPCVEIGVRQEGDGAEPVFYVRDNGIGITPPCHTKVFGLFHKLNPESEGTGVGLAIVKRIIEAHGGRIWVESTGQGQGSAFCFTLAPQPASTGGHVGL